MLYSKGMYLLALLATLSVPAHAAVSLRWAPALDLAMSELTGSELEAAKGFDAEALKGLQVRLNEIHALSRVHVENLDALRRFHRRPDAAVMSAERLAALERSLVLFSPVIARLEAQGIRISDRGDASTALGPALSLAILAEGREADRRAQALASRYEGNQPLDMALADSAEADALLRNRYPYLSTGALDGLARVYDSGRTQRIAARLAAEGDQVAIVTPKERETMRDAVADNLPLTFSQRLKARARAMAARISKPLR